MAVQQIEINIPIFERNLKLFSKKGLRRTYSSVEKHSKEYMDVAPLSSSSKVVMEVTLDKEYAEEFQELLKNQGFEILGSNFTFHLDNLIKDYEVYKSFFENKKEQIDGIKAEIEKRKKENTKYLEVKNDDVKFYFLPYNDKTNTLYDFIKNYKDIILDYAVKKDITIMLNPLAFSNQLKGFFGFNFFDADEKTEVVVDYASSITVHVDFKQPATVYTAAVLLSGIGNNKEELASKDLLVHLICENPYYKQA